MCLSTVYKNKKVPEDILMNNVMRIECKDGLVILTDLMERQVAIEGTLQEANLADGYVIIREEIPQERAIDSNRAIKEEKFQETHPMEGFSPP